MAGGGSGGDCHRGFTGRCPLPRDHEASASGPRAPVEIGLDSGKGLSETVHDQPGQYDRLAAPRIWEARALTPYMSRQAFRLPA